MAFKCFSLVILFQGSAASTKELITERAQLEIEAKRVRQVQVESDPSGGPSSNTKSIPLLHLVKQLLKNVYVQSESHLDDLTSRNGKLPSAIRKAKQQQLPPNLDLILKFQRLLFFHVFRLVSPAELDVTDSSRDLPGALSVLRKYCHMLNAHIQELIPLATSIAGQSAKHLYGVSEILEREAVGVLLPEFVLSCTLLVLEEGETTTGLR